MQYPNDISTIFSIAPFAINEFKPGLYPGHFKLEACLDDARPNSLEIKSSVHMMTIGGKKQPIPVTTPSYEIAKGVVTDFLDGQLFTEEDAHPGICWLQGKVHFADFVEKHADMHQAMKETQRRWLVLVIKKTEDDWKKYHNSRVITDQARFAARALGIPTPEWMSTEEIGMNFNKCPACSTMNDPANCVCTGCRCILDAEKFKTLQFAK